MTPEEMHVHRDQLAYMTDVKKFILSDARALFSSQGYTSHKSSFDVITSSFGGGYQAYLIVYPDLSTDTKWVTLYEGLHCKSLCLAVKLLWDELQMNLGCMKGMVMRTLTVSPEEGLISHDVARQPVNAGQAVAKAQAGGGEEAATSSKKHARASSAVP